MTTGLFLPNVPEEHVRARLLAAGGDEIASGRLAHPESSAALAVNAFGRFIHAPQLFPPLPGTEAFGAAEDVDVEFCARLPWTGGRHPWLDAVIVTPSHLIGVESKRFEPFRDTKLVAFSASYDRPVWGDRMERYCAARDKLRSGELKFIHLDAAQLIKHAFGLVTEARRQERQGVLFYLYVEPDRRGDHVISPNDHQRHAAEVRAFASAVAGDAVTFLAASYREWLASWPQHPETVQHRQALLERFGL